MKQKDGKYFKTSSLSTIRAAIERYLKQLPLNKPWSIVGDPAFASANKVLNAICRKNAQEGNACPVVHKPQASTAAFPNRPGQLGECEIQDPAQFLRRPISISPSILVKESVKIKESLQKKCCHSSQPPKVANLMSLEICWELKSHQGGLHDSNNESDGKVFAVLTSLRCPVKKNAKLLQSHEF